MSAIAAAIAVLTASPSAQAIEIDAGNPDIAMRWDNTLRYNLGARVRSQDQAILRNFNFDDGDRNFDKNRLVTNRLDLLSEFDLRWRKTMGMRVSAAAWYDDTYKKISGDNLSPTTTNNLVNGAPAVGYNDYVKRYYRGPSGELLDAFVFGKFDAGDVPVSVKLGRSIEYWGEALFSNTHGISYAQMPIDGAKAVATPGIEAKEQFRPINNLTVRVTPTANISVAAQYFLDWEPSKIAEPGTYFAPIDFVGNSGQMLRLGGPLFATRLPDVTPKERGEYGVSLRWNVDEIESTFGFYYRNFADKSGQLHVSNFTGAVPGRYFLAFADNIDLYGVSWSKQIAGWSVGTELSYRKNMPLASDTVPVLTAASLPGLGQTNGARGNTWHALINAVKLLPGTAVYDSLALQGELAWNRWDKVTQGAVLFKGRDNYTLIDKVTKDFVGITLVAAPSWLQVMPGVDLTMPVVLGGGISGVSAVSGGGNKKAGSASLGLTADIDQRHRLDLKYTTFFGEYATSPTTGAVTAFNGGAALLKDRAYVSLTFKTSF